MLDAGPGDSVGVGGCALTLLAPYPRADSSPTGTGNRLWRARVDGDLPAPSGAAAGRSATATSTGTSRSAYQSVFGTEPGSAEMPSAGRPFTHEVITGLVARGVGVAPITLHTGVSSQEAGEAPQPEWYDVPVATARLATATRAAGGRVVAVGTTATRALESAVEGDRWSPAAAGPSGS